MSFEIGGKIIAVLDKRNGISTSTNTPWSVQQYVIETHEQYPKKLCFDVFGEDKINQFNIQIGEELTVYFDINAREYQGRWYNSFRAWKVERTTLQASIPVQSVIDNGKDELDILFGSSEEEPPF
ncbi:DUF3127 domain-containing protein [Bacteroides gallinaceum]|uniref:DUF3127 domain-containing protein n=1 Tax=Bacteroides gallinaceum TaxID=1462571 RepID=UPI0025AA7D45|nr:DUF3127 domain-containing protein [Bacteroides gallinaceum]MDN0080894.1 DUF3127 domain-containing protein [Bacteroides gallinaceum]